LGATTLSTAIATIIGLVSGFIGGRLDTVVQRFVDAWMAFPGLIILITVMSLTGRGLPQIILVMGFAGGIGGSRVVRSAVIGIKENLYVEAAKATGSPTHRTLTQHILPNIMAPIIIIFSTTIGGVIMAEASLSFLGYGVPPGTASWGSMLSLEGRAFLEQAPWLGLYPGLALSIVVYGTNMLGDAVRDLLDPRLRGGVGRYTGVKRKKS
jgi:peptide/nickel transport system permease protein